MDPINILEDLLFNRILHPIRDNVSFNSRRKVFVSFFQQMDNVNKVKSNAHFIQKKAAKTKQFLSLPLAICFI